MYEQYLKNNQMENDRYPLKMYYQQYFVSLNKPNFKCLYLLNDWSANKNVSFEIFKLNIYYFLFFNIKL